MRLPALRHLILLLLCTAALAAGAAAHLGGHHRIAQGAWAFAILLALVPLLVSMARSIRRGEPGVDIVAALAMLGAIVLGEYLAGAVIALMLASGRALEEHAAARARRELSALLERTPHFAHRYEGTELVQVPIDHVRSGDRLLVKSGEVVPVDGIVMGETAVLDESALTGESLPITYERGDQVCSGTVNAGGPFDIQALATGANSTYAGVVRLVEAAQRAKAPFVRLADRATHCCSCRSPCS